MRTVLTGMRPHESAQLASIVSCYDQICLYSNELDQTAVYELFRCTSLQFEI